MASTSSFMLTPTRSPPRTPPPARQTLSLRLLSPPPLPKVPSSRRSPLPPSGEVRSSSLRLQNALGFSRSSRSSPIWAKNPNPKMARLQGKIEKGRRKIVEKENKKKVKKAFSSTPTGLFTPSASPDALMEIDQKNVFEVSFDRREREGDEKKGGEKERGLRLGIGLLPAFELA
ncbi:hypothetical protein BT69DRAFT_513275 [Atractiella rhizophila]|nr:hypothetical protein BT69DRAFT_513275 [Atractiella rhizophila]